MYQGKLQQAEMYAQYAREEAQKSGNEKQIFKAELLSVMARMSGWYNIFFCIQDIPIHEGLIEKLMQNNYRNHLAHIYIYAYDNRPEMVARAYRSEASLLYFIKGWHWQKRLEMSSWYMMHIRKTLCLHQRMV